MNPTPALKCISLVKTSGDPVADRFGTVTGQMPITGLTHLAAVVCNQNWSPYLFKDNKRSSENFVTGHFFAVDIDEGLSLEEAVRLSAPYKCFIATSKSHQVSKRGEAPCDRFRIVFELSHPLASRNEVYATFSKLKRELFPTMDDACKDPARYFFACKERVWSNPDPAAIALSAAPAEDAGVVVGAVSAPDPTTKGKLARSTIEFIAMGSDVPPGSRHAAMIKPFKDLKQNGYSEDEARDLLSSKIEWWDAHADRQLTDIYRRPVKHAPRILDTDEHGANAPTKEWVIAWLITNEVSVSYSRVLKRGRQTVTRSDILREMRLYRMAEGTKRSHPDQDIEDVFDQWIETARVRHIDHVREQLTGFDQAGCMELEKFIRALTGKVEPVEVCVMKHWLWQVKRKLFEMPVVEHMMPVFYGLQGGGKTVAVEDYLLKPLGELATKSSLKTLVDPRETRLIMDHFVLFFDEMAGAKNVEVEELKRIVTSGRIKLRQMRETHHETGIVNATFIGATNKPLADRIKDTTGMRRFYEIKTLPKADWDAVGAIDYTLLWKAVDEKTETKNAPYYEMRDLIKKAQQELRHKDPVEEFVDARYELVDLNATNGVLCEEIAEEFNQWNKINWPTPQVGRSLRQIPGISFKRTTQGVRYGLQKRPEVASFEYAKLEKLRKPSS